MSRWLKRSEGEKFRIFEEQSNPHKQSFKARMGNIRMECEQAKKRAGYGERRCSACDLRCPGCPFESAWPKEQKSV